MHIVITGATGNVGTSVIEALAEDASVTSVLGLARRLPELAGAQDPGGRRRTSPTMTWPRTCEAPTRWSIWRGCSSRPMTRSPPGDRTSQGSIRVFGAAAEAGVRTLVYASSVGAYSPGPKDRPVDESWPTHGWPTARRTPGEGLHRAVLDTFERDQPAIRVVRLRPGFIFKRESATEQRRLFAGPLLPNGLARPGLIPAVPDWPGCASRRCTRPTRARRTDWPSRGRFVARSTSPRTP